MLSELSHHQTSLLLLLLSLILLKLHLLVSTLLQTQQISTLSFDLLPFDKSFSFHLFTLHWTSQFVKQVFVPKPICHPRWQIIWSLLNFFLFTVLLIPWESKFACDSIHLTISGRSLNFTTFYANVHSHIFLGETMHIEHLRTCHPQSHHNIVKYKLFLFLAIQMLYHPLHFSCTVSYNLYCYRVSAQRTIWTSMYSSCL